MYTSLDNVAWTRARDYHSAPFSEIFLRYEIQFERLTARYIKLVAEPQPQERPVFVTELRALITRDAVPEGAWDADHQASVQTQFRPTNWLFWGIEGSLMRVGAGPTTIGRTQEGTRASLRIQPSPVFEFTTHYQVNQTTYSHSVNPRTTSELNGLSLRSRWLPALQTVLNVSRQRETLDGILARRLDAGSAQLHAGLLTNLGSVTEVGVSMDRRFSTDSRLRSRYLSEAVNARPLERLQLTGEYRLARFEAQQRSVPASRQNLSLRGMLRLSPSISLQGELTQSREAKRDYVSWDAMLGWLPTPKWSLNAGANSERPGQGPNTVLYTFQGTFRLSPRMDFSGSYAYFDSGESARRDYSNLRFGFNLSI